MAPASDRRPNSQFALLRRFFFNDLVALQFGLDATLYLPTVYAFVATLQHDAPFFVSLAQLLPSAVQFLVSLAVGPAVGLLGCSLKWAIVAFVAACAIGNVLYSCAGQHAISSVWAIIGGRMVCGLASGASSLSMAYLSVSTSPAERLPAFSAYRTVAGVALILGPLLSVPLTLFSFNVGDYRIDGTNAPTFFSAASAAAVAITSALFIEDHAANRMDTRAFAELRTMRWAGPSLCLAAMFVSAFLMADVMYLMSVMLTSPEYWRLSLTLASGLQAAVFCAALVASFGAGPLRTWLTRVLKRADDIRGRASTDAEATLSVAAFTSSAVGLAVLMAGINLHSSPALGAFLIGATLMLGGYNVQAATLPSLYTKSMPTGVRVVMTPWYAAMVAAGKLAAPAVVHVITRSAGDLVPQGVCIALCVLGVLLVGCLRLVSHSGTTML